MSDFLNYWDTRIIRHKRVFDAHPQIANFAYCECEKIWDYMEGESKALLARHNALVDAVHKAMGRTADCDKKQTNDQLIADVAYLNRLALGDFKTSIICRNRAFAAEQKYDELRERVEWMLECDAAHIWIMVDCPLPSDENWNDIVASCIAARQAVEELL